MNKLRCRLTPLLASLPVTLLVVLLAPCSTAQAQAKADPLVGCWRGTLRAGVARLEVALNIRADGDGYRATFDSLTQGVRDIPVAALERDGDRVIARLPAIGAEFISKLVDLPAPFGPKLDGTWKQGGQRLDLALTPGDATPPRRPQQPGDDVPYAREEVTFGHDPARGLEASFRVGAGAPVTLAGTLTLPEGDGPHPVAVMITGSGAQDRDETLAGHRPFLVIADHLTRRGVAVLRFDDRGTAASTGDFATATSADFADDARAALRFLLTRDDIDHARMGLIGHSEGGVVAPLVATGPDRDLVAFAALLAPPGVNIADVIAHQSRLIGRAQGGAPELIDRNIEMSAKALAAVRDNPEEPEVRAAALRAIATEHWSKLPSWAREAAGEGVEDVVAQLARVDTPWMRWLLRHDPAPTLRDTRCHVLAVFGAKDLQVDPAQNRPPIEAALADRSRPAKVVTIEGVNHLFQHSETGRPSEYGELEETFAPEALRLLQEWIAQVTGG